MKPNMKTAILSTLTAVGIAGSALAAGPEVTTTKLADNVYSMDALHYNSLVVIGDDGVLITDPANPFRAGLLKEEIARLTDLPVSKIVMTHEHYDHVGGTNVFPMAEVVAQENFDVFMDKDPLGMLPEKLDVTFDDAMSIDMGTTTVDLHHFGPADGIAIAVVHLPEEGVVVTSDMYAPKALTRGLFLTDSNVLGNRQILNELATWDLNYAITTHSGEMGVEHLIEGAEFHNDLYDAVYPTIEKVYQENPAGLVNVVIELGETVELPKYEGWANYQDLGEHVRKMGFAITHGG